MFNSSRESVFNSSLESVFNSSQKSVFNSSRMTWRFCHMIRNKAPHSIRGSLHTISWARCSWSRTFWPWGWCTRHDRRLHTRTGNPTLPLYRYHRTGWPTCSRGWARSWSRHNLVSTHSRYYAHLRAQQEHLQSRPGRYKNMDCYM